jgi:hypothetical protein
MTRALHRRLDRLREQIAVGRLITLSVAHEHVEDRALIDATLAAGGIQRTDADVVVLLNRYDTPGAEPACGLLSVTPLPSNTRKALQ